MSFNIHIASEGIIITPSGKETAYHKAFACLQTPTRITEQIIESEDPSQVYKDWVKSNEHIEIEETVDIDQWDEETNYYKVIGQYEYSFAQEHIDELNKFIEEETSLGFKIMYYGF